MFVGGGSNECSSWRMEASRWGLCGSMLCCTITLRACALERYTSDVIPSAMGTQFSYVPILTPVSEGTEEIWSTA